jgi:hypothetical protein
MTDEAKTPRSEFSFGELFHTSLRKGIDTKWSALMWNILNLDSDDFRSAWKDMGEFCQKEWEAGKKPSECAKKWARLQNNTFRPGGAVILDLAISIMNDETWEDVDEAIEYWVTS